jgi:CheY-like chemotaxis protein
MTAPIAQDIRDTTTVLLVDDEPDNVDLLQVYLEAKG